MNDESGREEPEREWRGSTKFNSTFKWKRDRSVVGALEVTIDPQLDLRAEMTVHEIVGYEEEFRKYHDIWNDLRLRDEFIKEFESIPPHTTCCGFLTEQDKTIKFNSKVLNKGWAKKVNENLLLEKGFRISIFVWQWNNIAGKAETVVPMIRFHSLKKTKKKT